MKCIKKAIRFTEGVCVIYDSKTRAVNEERVRIFDTCAGSTEKFMKKAAKAFPNMCILEVLEVQEVQEIVSMSVETFYAFGTVETKKENEKENEE